MTDMMEILKSGGALANSDLFKELQETNDKLTGGGGTYKRISLKGGKFRQYIGGEQVNVSKESSLPIIIIDAAPVGKTYYEGDYSPDNAVPPTCWSSDSKEPDAKVPADQRQSVSCKDCPQAIKGSGQGTSSACRYSQRLAVALEGNLKEVYQLSLPAKSIFGSPEAGHMPMQAYAKYLNSHKVPAIAAVTNMYFDDNADTPKLFFKPERMLTEEELTAVVALRDSDETKEAITMTVSEADGVEPEEDKAPAKKAPAKKAPAKKKEEVEEEEVVEEPVKAAKKTEPEPEVDDDLADLIDDWDD